MAKEKATRDLPKAGDTVTVYYLENPNAQLAEGLGHVLAVHGDALDVEVKRSGGALLRLYSVPPGDEGPRRPTWAPLPAAK